MTTKKGIHRRNYSRKKIQELRENARYRNAEARCELGLAYAEGNGVMQSNIKAIFWICSGIEFANEDFCYGIDCSLGEILDDEDCGEFVPEICIKAANWLRQAAGDGWAQAEYALGTLMEGRVELDEEGSDYYEAMRYGLEPPIEIEFQIKKAPLCDDKGALFWYGRAAMQGHLNAQLCLGRHYEGLSECTLLCEEYNATGMIFSGFCCEWWEVAPDKKEALKWYSMAAEQGSRDALSAIERLTNG